MTGRLSKLQQDLVNIESEVGDLAQKIHERYQIYLNLLSDSVYKQAIGAVYHLCTRSYPGEFLALSHANRQKFQEDIKSLCQENRHSLEQLGAMGLDRVSHVTLETSANVQGASDPPNLLKVRLEKAPSEPPTRPTNNPDALLHWCRALEKSCIDILSHLSRKITHQLQQAYILPSRLPSQILDRAIQAEDGGQSLSGGHNLLNIMIEGERSGNDGSEEEEEEREEEEEPIFAAKIMKITALHLRLSEIEFADTRLNLERNQLRALWEELDRLRDQYHRTHREYTIAQAESAWRGSWYE
jgi:hypothetical protein